MPPGEKAVTYGETGETYYIILKGLCQVEIPNSEVVNNWHRLFKDYNSLKEWRKEKLETRIKAEKKVRWKQFK